MHWGGCHTHPAGWPCLMKRVGFFGAVGQLWAVALPHALQGPQTSLTYCRLSRVAEMLWCKRTRCGTFSCVEASLMAPSTDSPPWVDFLRVITIASVVRAQRARVRHCSTSPNKPSQQAYLGCLVSAAWPCSPPPGQRQPTTERLAGVVRPVSSTNVAPRPLDAS